MNLVLIGYRGTGKTEVGKWLSRALNRRLYSFDQIIVERAGKPIPELVSEKGWEAFRDLETQVTQEYTQKDDCIFDTGGGCILREQNVQALKRNGILFWLRASVPEIVRRIQHDNQRPSLTGKSFTEEVEEVLRERTPRYTAAADYVIDTDGLTIEQVATKIRKLYSDHE